MLHFIRLPSKTFSNAPLFKITSPVLELTNKRFREVLFKRNLISLPLFFACNVVSKGCDVSSDILSTGSFIFMFVMVK